MSCLGTSIWTSVETAYRATSETANIPIITGISCRPLIKSADPKVNRGYAAGFSNPTVAMSSPSISETRPRIGSPGDTNTADVSPIITSQKYSKELNLSAAFASHGAAPASTIVPNKPPSTE